MLHSVRVSFCGFYTFSLHFRQSQFCLPPRFFYIQTCRTDFRPAQLARISLCVVAFVTVPFSPRHLSLGKKYSNKNAKFFFVLWRRNKKKNCCRFFGYRLFVFVLLVLLRGLLQTFVVVIFVRLAVGFITFRCIKKVYSISESPSKNKMGYV